MSVSTESGPNTPIDRTRVADQIFLDIRDQILTGALPHGSRLPTEKDLVARYQVSGPTVREAIRGLTATGLAEVRHGNGAFVAARGEALIATCFSAVIQLEDIGVSETLGVLSVLNEYAASCAADVATRDDISRLRAAIVQQDAATSPESAAVGVREFHRALAEASHNSLLILLCGFLVNLQTELAVDLADDISAWRKMFSTLHDLRVGLVDAIESRQKDVAAALTRDFHRQVTHLITSLPKALEIRLTDPKLGSLLPDMARRLKA